MLVFKCVCVVLGELILLMLIIGIVWLSVLFSLCVIFKFIFVIIELFKLFIFLVCCNLVMVLCESVVLVVIMLFILLLISEVVILLIFILFKFGVILMNSGIYLLWVCVSVFCVVFRLINSLLSVLLY